jgi:hypothetical protein
MSTKNKKAAVNTAPSNETKVSKKNVKATKVVESNPSTEQVTEPITEEVTIPNVVTASVEKKPLGRPVDPNSPRQKMLAEKAALREAGLLKRGRKVNPESARAIRMAERATKIAAGIEIKPGRPKMEKVEEIVTEEVSVETVNP